MRIKCDTGIQYALVKGVFDPETLKRQVERQITAAEDRNRRFLESAARRDIDAWVNSITYVESQPTNSPPQLSLDFDNAKTAKGLRPASSGQVIVLCQPSIPVLDSPEGDHPIPE